MTAEAATKNPARIRFRTPTMPCVFKLNDELSQAVCNWNEVAGDHTGTFPIPLQLLDIEDDGDEDIAAANRAGRPDGRG